MVVRQFLRLLLVTVMVTGSIASVSADTLTIEPQGTINLCKPINDRAFVIYVNIGEIYASDSLMSFDIFIKYDTTKVVFTNLLTIGTLAGQMKDLGPVWRPKDPDGVVYAGGASILRPAKGNIPLVAFQGIFKGRCGETTQMILDDVIFNSEFKRSYPTSIPGTLKSIIVPTATKAIRSVFSSKQFTVGGKDSTVRLPITVYSSSSTSVSPTATMRVKVESGHQGQFNIANAGSQSNDPRITVTGINNGDSTSSATFAMPFIADSATLFIDVISMTRTDSATARFLTSLSIDDTCACDRPANNDSMSICTVLNTTKNTVSVQQTVFHEGVDIHVTNTGDIIIQSLHGQPRSVHVFSMLGEELMLRERLEGQTRVITRDQLPSGPVFIQVDLGEGKVATNMLMK